MQQLKGKKVDASVDEEHKLTEIFVMLPLDIIAVGELTEGRPTAHAGSGKSNHKTGLDESS